MVVIAPSVPAVIEVAVSGSVVIAVASVIAVGVEAETLSVTDGMTLVSVDTGVATVSEASEDVAEREVDIMLAVDLDGSVLEV